MYAMLGTVSHINTPGEEHSIAYLKKVTKEKKKKKLCLLLSNAYLCPFVLLVATNVSSTNLHP